MKKIVSVCLLSFLLLFTTLKPVGAQVDFPQASDQQINEALGKIVPLRSIPSNPLYFLITAKENIVWFFEPSSLKKAQFNMILSDKRLKETYLLVANGDMKNAGRNLTRYDEQAGNMIDRLSRAKSQNQDTGDLIGEMADHFRNQEVLFYAIKKRAEGMGGQDKFSANYKKAADVFVGTITALDNFKPGIKNRFKSATDSADLLREKILDSAPRAPGFIEASPGVQPSKIIY